MESTGGVSRRGRRAFNDSLAPAEWSFSTYVRPFASAGGSGAGIADESANVHAVEEILWGLMAGRATYTAPVNGGADATLTGFTFGAVSGATTADPPTGGTALSFSDSNRSTLGTATIWFRLGESTSDYKWYKITSSVVNEASLDFEIDGIATINWSGFGAEIVEVAHASAVPNASGVDVDEAITSTSNFIRNRLTQLVAKPNQSATGQSGLQSSYLMTLTGGNITISNNVTYITPEELGSVNVPIGHVTGTRSVNGNFTCYLVNDGSNASADLLQDMQGITSVVTTEFALTFNVGGVTAATPRLSVYMPRCHIEIPTHDIADVISLTTNFMALPQTLDATNEVSVYYDA